MSCSPETRNYLHVILVAVFMIAAAASSKGLEYEIIHGNESTGKIKLFIFAEGYPEFMKESYSFDVASIVDTFFTISPYKDLQDLFIVYRVWTPSLISYIPAQSSDSTFFGGYRGTGGPPNISDSGLAKILGVRSGAHDTDFYCDRFN